MTRFYELHNIRRRAIPQSITTRFSTPAAGRFLRRLYVFIVLTLLTCNAYATETVFVSRAHDYGVTHFDPASQAEGLTNPVPCVPRSLTHVDDEPVIFGVNECNQVFALNTFTDALTVLASNFTDNFGIRGRVLAHPDGQRLFGSKWGSDIIEFDIASGTQTTHPVGSVVGILDISHNGRTLYFIDFVDRKLKSFDIASHQTTLLADVPNSPMSHGIVDPRGRFLLFSSQEIPSATQPRTTYYSVFIHRINLQTLAVDTVELTDAYEPKDMAITANGNEAYVLASLGIRVIDTSGPAMTVRTTLSRSTLGALDVDSSGQIWAIDDVLPYQLLVWNPGGQSPPVVVPIAGYPHANLYDIVIGNRPDCYDATDTDADGVGDSCDNCPATLNPEQRDTDTDGAGDVCDDDIDNDGILNVDDNCVYHPNPDQSDLDGDGTGDVCELFDKQAFLRMIDVRFQALVYILKDLGIGGPYGPWGPFSDCAWSCEKLPDYTAQFETGIKATNTYLARSFTGDTFSEGDIFSVLMKDSPVSKGMVQAYLKDRTGKPEAERKEPTAATLYAALTIFVALLLIVAVLFVKKRKT